MIIPGKYKKQHHTRIHLDEDGNKEEDTMMSYSNSISLIIRLIFIPSFSSKLREIDQNVIYRHQQKMERKIPGIVSESAIEIITKVSFHWTLK